VYNDSPGPNVQLRVVQMVIGEKNVAQTSV